MYISEHAVSPDFRAAIIAQFPALGNNRAYWRMLGLLMFAGGREGGEILLPAALVAIVEGKSMNGKYSAWTFLERFQSDVVRLDILPFTQTECRIVTHVHWPEEIVILLQAERRSSGGERVLLSSGAKWRREHSIQERRIQQAAAIETLSNMGHHPAYNLLNLLNNAAPNRFAALKKHLPEAHALVDTLPLVDSERERQHNILRAIELQAQPLYSPAARSVRIFSLNDSVTRLQRDVRHVMTQDWITCDLRSAQLAIVEKVWGGIPAVKELLTSGRSIWHSLCAWMGLDLTSENKAFLKNALYAIIFGAGRDRLIEQLGSRVAYKRLVANDVIRALLLARARELRRIRQEKGAIDAFGTLIPLEYISLPGKRYAYDSSRQIMALVAQSYELRLLTPVIDSAIEQADKQHGFSLMMWLHDGFSFVTHKESDKGHWKRTLQAAVRCQAERLGIETELECS